ncbi:DMT family transporter [Terribacillus saccharophilus]|uniref:DMT family transporter n=1 Tax=Terribacillus saccharophilus TaxID=361277 RepID=UPI002989FADC|nr:SMR family transporter [Terribacillus saccharophilus]
MILQKKSMLIFSVFILGLAASFTFLSLAMQSIPMETANAIWTGIGTVGSGPVGFYFMRSQKVRNVYCLWRWCLVPQ